jgi:hypothetical protein
MDINIEKDEEEEEPPAARHKRPRAMKFSQDIFNDVELKEIDEKAVREFSLNPWWLRPTPVKKEFPYNICVEGICLLDNQKHTYKSTTVRDRMNSR